jgi:hypothetical protein
MDALARAVLGIGRGDQHLADVPLGILLVLTGQSTEFDEGRPGERIITPVLGRCQPAAIRAKPGGAPCCESITFAGDALPRLRLSGDAL